jgi:ribosome-associated heat shock protein Hsp15
MADTGLAKDSQRLDKWLWHARIVKTRSLAAQLVADGKCRVNREKILKPAHAVKCGDVITAAVFGRIRVLQIAAIGGRRGPPGEARALYIELTAQSPEPPDPSLQPGASAAVMPEAGDGPSAPE